MRSIVNLVGNRYGRLKVLQLNGRDPQGRVLWLCHCDCGVLTTIRSTNLRSGNTASCSCIRRERSGRPVEHGLTNTPTYTSYSGAKDRCNNPNNKRYRHYGGRGIEFRFQSLKAFCAELGIRPAGKTLDRINVNGHYEPGNVRWATIKEQNNNKRGNN